MKYRILRDYSYEGMKFHDNIEYPTVSEAVKTAIDAHSAFPFLIVRVIDWEAALKCPYADCPDVHYKECPVHGRGSE